jgi:chromosomal replication initiator protein
MMAMRIKAMCDPGVEIVREVDAVLRAVARVHGLSTAQVLSRRRDRVVVECRQSVMYVLYDQFPLSYNWIGEYFGRDHGTVMYAVRVVRVLIEADRAFAARWPAVVRAAVAARCGVTAG